MGFRSKARGGGIGLAIIAALPRLTPPLMPLVGITNSTPQLILCLPELNYFPTPSATERTFEGVTPSNQLSHTEVLESHYQRHKGTQCDSCCGLLHEETNMYSSVLITPLPTCRQKAVVLCPGVWCNIVSPSVKHCSLATLRENVSMSSERQAREMREKHLPL